MNDGEKLARDFLDAVASMEGLLKVRGGIKARGLGEVVRSLEGGDAMVARYRVELMAFASLRNAIVHHPYRNGQPIATPLPETVEAARKILAEFESPSRAQKWASHPVTFDESDALQPCLRVMASKMLSQAPVMKEGGFSCMLTTNAVARWLAANIDDNGDVLLENVRVADVVKHLEDHETAQFIRSSLSAAEAVQMLTSDCPPIALLITNGGKRSESLLGILVQSDVQTIQLALKVAIA